MEIKKNKLGNTVITLKKGKETRVFSRFFQFNFADDSISEYTTNETRRFKSDGKHIREFSNKMHDRLIEVFPHFLNY